MSDFLLEGGGVKQRLVEVRPGEHAPEVVVVAAQAEGDAPVISEVTAAAEEGRMYVVGKAITTTSATEKASLRITNPANSGKVMVVLMIEVFSSLAQQIRYRDLSAQGGPGNTNSATPRNMNQYAHNPPAPKGQANWSTTALTGGEVWDNESRVDPAAPLHISLSPGIPLAPGKSFAVEGGTPGIQTTTINLTFYEK